MILNSHALLIPAKVQKSIDAQTKVELKIPQLTLAKIAQMGRYETVNTRSEHYSGENGRHFPVKEK